MDPNPDQKSFQFVATFELRGSCDKRFLRLTLRRKVESADRWRRRVQRDFLGSAIGAERILWDPPWGRTDFFGVDPKKVPLVCSAAPPSARPIGPLTPRPLSRKGRGEKELGESAGMHGSIPWAPALCPCPTFFGWSPKKSPFFSAPKKPKKSLLVVAGGLDLVIRRLFEMGQECTGLRQVGLEAQRLFELRIGLRWALMRSQDHSEIGMGGCRAEDL